jgi:hypothetical protein
VNVLITNSQEDQAYLVLRALRGTADRILITMSGDSFFGRWGGMSPWSRYVDKRYRVPDCTADWRAGVIGPENTAAEERYIERIEEICALERIDFVFPSYDAEVCVLAKNRERLKLQGVTAVVPNFEAVEWTIDKSLTLAAAERAGFPVPRTRQPQSIEELRQASRELKAPWVLKPRCNAHGVNIRLVGDLAELEVAWTELNRLQERPLLQEYVPPASKRNFYVLANPDSEIVTLFSPRVQRLRKIGTTAPCAAVVSTADVPYHEEVRALLREAGVWGALTVQSIIDARDGEPRLMEINPRFGHNLWFRTELGINEPLMYLRMAAGEAPGDPPPLREGVLLLDPLWDMLHLLGQALDQSAAWLRSVFRRAGTTEDLAEKEHLGELLKDLREEYFGRTPRITNPLNRGYLSDPLPPVARIIRVIAQAIKRRAA